MPNHADAVTALETNCWSMFSILGTGPGGRVVDTPNELIIESPLTKPPYNGIFRLREPEDGSLAARVSEIWDGFTTRGVAGVVLVTPSAPGGLRGALTDNGLERVETIHGMAMDLSDLPPIPPSPEGVDIFEATGEDSADWVNLVSWRYGLEPTTAPYLREVFQNAIGGHTRLWVARAGDEPVSKVGMHLREGVAGIYGVATTEGGRRKGLATNLTIRSLHAARDAGATATVLHSTPMARGLYRSLGYADVADFEIWAAPDTLHI